MTTTKNTGFIVYSADELSYRAAWFVEGQLYLHEGKVGERGKTKLVNADWKTAQFIIDIYQKQAQRDGYTEWDRDKLADVIIILELDETRFLEQLDLRHALEDEVDEALGWTGNGRCTGGDIGGGTLQIFCETVLPEKAISLINKILRKVRKSFKSIQVTHEAKSA